MLLHITQPVIPHTVKSIVFPRVIVLDDQGRLYDYLSYRKLTSDNAWNPEFHNAVQLKKPSDMIKLARKYSANPLSP